MKLNDLDIFPNEKLEKATPIHVNPSPSLKSLSCNRSIRLPSKHGTLVWHLCNVGLMSKTLDWRCINVVRVFCANTGYVPNCFTLKSLFRANWAKTRLYLLPVVIVKGFKLEQFLSLSFLSIYLLQICNVGHVSACLKTSAHCLFS